jgi:hypothetical protein
VRDLKKKDVTWLRHLRSTLTKAVETLYEGVENDMLKFYIHCACCLFHIMVLLHTFDPVTDNSSQTNPRTITSTFTSSM